MDPSVITLAELPALYRREADTALLYSDVAHRVWNRAAEMLESVLAAQMDEVLSMSDAAYESGWNVEALCRKLRKQPDLNAGSHGAPAIRRKDLIRLPRGRGPRRRNPETMPPHQSGAAAPSRKFEEIKERAVRART